VELSSELRLWNAVVRETPPRQGVGCGTDSDWSIDSTPCVSPFQLFALGINTSICGLPNLGRPPVVETTFAKLSKGSRYVAGNLPQQPTRRFFRFCSITNLDNPNEHQIIRSALNCTWRLRPAIDKYESATRSALAVSRDPSRVHPAYDTEAREAPITVCTNSPR